MPYQMFLFWVDLIQKQKLVRALDINLTAVDFSPAEGNV